MSSFSRSTPRLCYLILGSCTVVLGALASPPALAQSSSAIAQQFQTNDPGVTPASIVSIQKELSSSVELATIERTDKLVGVTANSPLIELSNGGSGVQVVTDGPTLTLVSDLNGPVVSGDKITISPIAGVGMKATRSTTIVGIAQANLRDVQGEQHVIKDKTGRTVTSRIGLVPVRVGVVFYSDAETSKGTFVPSFLQNVANAVANRSVSSIRVLIAALILVLVFVSVGVLLFSAVRSSIISIGRNPLSARAVRRSFLQVALMVLVILLFASGLMYIVLTV